MRRTSASSRPLQRRDVLAPHEHLPAVRPHQADDVVQRHALAGAAASEQAERPTLPSTSRRHVVEHLAISKAFVTWSSG